MSATPPPRQGFAVSARRSEPGQWGDARSAGWPGRTVPAVPAERVGEQGRSLFPPVVPRTPRADRDGPFDVLLDLAQAGVRARRPVLGDVVAPRGARVVPARLPLRAAAARTAARRPPSVRHERSSGGGLGGRARGRRRGRTSLFFCVLKRRSRGPPSNACRLTSLRLSSSRACSSWSLRHRSVEHSAHTQGAKQRGTSTQQGVAGRTGHRHQVGGHGVQWCVVTP